MIILFLLILATVSQGATVTTFVSPDNSYEVLENFLADSDQLYIASYTFESPHVADLIRNKKSLILVEKSPVGGMSSEQTTVLCDLSDSGTEIFLYDGPARFHHAKYIVNNNKVLISTENFGDSGYSKNKQGNRGWGVVVEDNKISNELLQIFNDDLKNSERFFCNEKINFNFKKSKSSYKPIFKSKTYLNQNVSLVVAPDAVEKIIDLIEGAKNEIYTEQFYIYRFWDRKSKTENDFLESLIEKSRQGLEVKVLLDGTWYNLDKNDIASNYYTNKYLNENGIQSKISELDVEKIHTKGLVIDKKALVSSINWNLNSPQNNREIGIIIEGDAALYFRDVFLYDFNYNENKINNKNFDLIISIVIILIIILFIVKLNERRKIFK